MEIAYTCITTSLPAEEYIKSDVRLILKFITSSLLHMRFYLKGESVSSRKEGLKQRFGLAEVINCHHWIPEQQDDF